MVWICILYKVELQYIHTEFNGQLVNRSGQSMNPAMWAVQSRLDNFFSSKGEQITSNPDWLWTKFTHWSSKHCGGSWPFTGWWCTLKSWLIGSLALWPAQRPISWKAQGLSKRLWIFLWVCVGPALFKELLPLGWEDEINLRDLWKSPSGAWRRWRSIKSGHDSTMQPRWCWNE